MHQEVKRELHSKAYSLCNAYDQDGTIDMSDIPQDELARLSSVLLQDENWFCESTSSDNREYFKRVQPALIAYLNFQNEETAKELLKEIKQSIMNYHQRVMQDELYDAMAILNLDRTTGEACNFN